MLKKYKQLHNGFTLIELLIVIAVVAILAAGVFVALDPARRFKDSRDSTRFTDVSAILEAAKVDQVDNGGNYLAAIDNATAGTDYMIGTASGALCALGANPCDVTIAATNCVNLADLATEGYLASIPVSSNGAGTWDAAMTGYYLNKSATGNLTIGACESENTTAIKVSR